ncbi:MAG: hypothetical protein ACWA5W_11015 [Phycisphaerales bacterium]
MQSPLFEPTNLPSLPETGLIDHWVYESPWIPAAAVLIIALATLFALRHTDRARRVGWPIAIVGMLLASGLVVAGQLVVTDTEHLRHRADRLIQAAASADGSELNLLLDESVRFDGNNKLPTGSRVGKDTIIALSNKHAKPIIESAQVKEVHAGLYSPRVAQTQIKVHISSDFAPPNSWWLVDWTRPTPDSTQWTVTHIEPIWIQGL